jgi:hypothetical protein
MATFIGLLFCGITLDIGVIEYTRLLMQRAADAAVVGAQVSHDQEDVNWTNNGVLDAQANGFTNGSSNTTVTVTEVPTSGSYAGHYDAVQAKITKTVNTFFMGILNGGVQTLSVQSVALMTPCVYITNAYGWGTVPYPLSLISGSSIGYFGGSTNGCPVYVNKGVSVDANSALWLNATNITGASSSSLLAGGIFHQPRFGSSVLADPLAYRSACMTLSANCIHGTASGVQPPSTPSPSSCSYTNHVWPSGSIALSPGTYCNSFSFINSTVTLSPGLYIIANGGTWTNSTVTGNGVTLYFTQSGDGKYGTFTTSATTMHLSAPTISSGGALATILLMNDPAWVPMTAQDFTFLNGSTNDGDGIYYTVNTGISIQFSTLSATHYLGLDVDNLRITSSALAPKSNFTTVASGNPFTPIGSLVQ